MYCTKKYGLLYLISIGNRPDVFWPSFFQEKPIQINADIKSIVEISLVLATSSSSVERTFSIMEHMRGKHR